MKSPIIMLRGESSKIFSIEWVMNMIMSMIGKKSIKSQQKKAILQIEEANNNIIKTCNLRIKDTKVQI